jgi:hypothetical protein
LTCLDDATVIDDAILKALIKETLDSAELAFEYGLTRYFDHAYQSLTLRVRSIDDDSSVFTRLYINTRAYVNIPGTLLNQIQRSITITTSVAHIIHTRLREIFVSPCLGELATTYGPSTVANEIIKVIEFYTSIRRLSIDELDAKQIFYAVLLRSPEISTAAEVMWALFDHYPELLLKQVKSVEIILLTAHQRLVRWADGGCFGDITNDEQRNIRQSVDMARELLRRRKGHRDYWLAYYPNGIAGVNAKKCLSFNGQPDNIGPIWAMERCISSVNRAKDAAWREGRPRPPHAGRLRRISQSRRWIDASFDELLALYNHDDDDNNTISSSC